MKKNQKIVKNTGKKSVVKNGCDNLIYFEDFGELLTEKTDEAIDAAMGDSLEYQFGYNCCDVLSVESACKIVMKNADEVVEALKKKSFCCQLFQPNIKKKL